MSAPGPTASRRTAPSGEELAARRRVGDLDVDLPSMAAVSNIFRVANAARNYFERAVLREFGLTFSGFTVLWALWVNGPTETRHLAAEASITKGTLTGVLKTLESLELVRRSTPQADRRLTVVQLTRKGHAKMRAIFPKFNQAEARIMAPLNAGERASFTAALRAVLGQLKQL